MNLAEQIKAKYPNPVAVGDVSNGAEGYCVGGAVCMFAGVARPKNIDHFPAHEQIAFGLVMLNPKLSRSQAEESAKLIIAHNDVGDFPWAWRTLENALAA